MVCIRTIPTIEVVARRHTGRKYLDNQESWELFRFRSVDKWLRKELTDCELYHSAPEDFNDPFDCRVDADNAIVRALQEELAPDRRATVEAFQAAFRVKPPRELDVGVCCYSVNADNPLMWSHYANSHRGVCLRYRIPATYFMERYPPSAEQPFFVGCERVYYGDDRYKDWLVSDDLTYPRPEAIENAVSRIFVTKGQCWSHEEEVRTVVSKSKWAMEFEPHFLTEVIFGLKTTDADKLEVAKLALRNNPDVSFSQAKVHADKDFGMDFVPIALELPT